MRGIETLRELDCATLEGAARYLEAFNVFEQEHGSGGTHQPRPASWKPFSVVHPWIFAKLRQADEILELNYWQMDYAMVAKKFYGLPWAKWEDERVRRGLCIASPSPTSQATA